MPLHMRSVLGRVIAQFNLTGWVIPNLSWLSCSVCGIKRLSKVVLSFLQVLAAVRDLKNLHLMGTRNR